MTQRSAELRPKLRAAVGPRIRMIILWQRTGSSMREKTGGMHAGWTRLKFVTPTSEHGGRLDENRDSDPMTWSQRADLPSARFNTHELSAKHDVEGFVPNMYVESDEDTTRPSAWAKAFISSPGNIVESLERTAPFQTSSRHRSADELNLEGTR